MKKKVGQIWKVESNGDTNYYLVASQTGNERDSICQSMGRKLVSLININSGYNWDKLYPVEDGHNISDEEWAQIAGHEPVFVADSMEDYIEMRVGKLLNDYAELILKNLQEIEDLKKEVADLVMSKSVIASGNANLKDNLDELVRTKTALVIENANLTAGIKSRDKHISNLSTELIARPQAIVTWGANTDIRANSQLNITSGPLKKSISTKALVEELRSRSLRFSIRYSGDRITEFHSEPKPDAK